MVDDTVLGLVIIVWIFDLWEVYLYQRQLRLTNQSAEMPKPFVGHYHPRDYEKIRHRWRHLLSIVILTAAVQLCVKTVALMTPYHKALWHITEDLWPHARPPAFAALHIIVTRACLLPFVMLEAFAAPPSERVPSPIIILIMSVLQIAITALKTAMLHYALMLLIEAFGIEIFVYFSVSSNVIGLIFITLSIAVLMPIQLAALNELQVGKLVENLAIRVGFDPRKIVVSNEPVPTASYTGLFGFSVIIITQALASILSPKEVCAVVAHELGHWAYGQSTVGYLMFTGFMSLGFVYSSYGMSDDSALKLFSLPADTDRPHSSVPVHLGLYYVWPVINGFLRGLSSCLGRNEEFHADEYAAQHGYGKFLKASLMNLYVRVGDYPVQDKWFCAWYIQHPSLMERIQRLDNPVHFNEST